PDIAVAAFADLDQLLRVTADILVQAEVIEIRKVVVEVLDLKDSAGVPRVVAERRRPVQSEVGGDNPIPALDVTFGRLGAGCSALSRGRDRFTALPLSRLDIRGQVAFDRFRRNDGRRLFDGRRRRRYRHFGLVFVERDDGRRRTLLRRRSGRCRARRWCCLCQRRRLLRGWGSWARARLRLELYRMRSAVI